MKIQIVITHLVSGTTSKSEIQEFTERELENLQDKIKDSLDTMTYFEIGGDIWPGDVIRSSCVISFKLWSNL